MNRLLQGLARSLSPDAIVDAIVAELIAGTDADHVAVAHLRRPDAVVEVTLSSALPGVATSRTWLRPEVAAPADPRAAPPARPRRPAEVDAGSADPADPLPAAPVEDPAALAAEAAEEIARRVRAAYGLTHTLAAPLVADGRFEGALILSRRTRAPWGTDARRTLAWSADEVAAAFARAGRLAAAEHGARTDALTGLPNRRAFDALLAELPARRRTGDALAILMLDIDHFKDLNDRYGHAAGDAVLRAVGAALAAALRSGDSAVRYGGEEFAVILRGASADQAAEVGERLRRVVADLDAAVPGTDAPVTVSVGAALAAPDEDPAAVVRRADAALYAAKAAGRDRVAVG